MKVTCFFVLSAMAAVALPLSMVEQEMMAAPAPTTAAWADYVDKRKTKMAHETGGGYFTMELPKMPKTCEDECLTAICKRHCQQAFAHKQQADKLAASKTAIQATIKKLETTLSSEKLKLTATEPRRKYHDRKFKEWQEAHKHQHILDVATRDYEKNLINRKAAEKEYNEAKTAAERARAQLALEHTAWKTTKAAKAKVDADLLKNNALLKTKKEELEKLKTLDEKKLTAEIAALEKTIATDNETAKKLVAKLTGHVTAVKAKQAAKEEAEKVEKAKKEAHEALKAKTDLTTLKKNAKEKHDIAKDGSVKEGEKKPTPAPRAM